MIFQSLLTTKLSKKRINEILILKNSYWKHGMYSQKKWFNKNAKSKDYHNLMICNNKVVGYTFLANRKLEIITKNKKIFKKKYLLFQTLIISKKFRNYLNLSKFMKFNNYKIKKQKKLSFLLCKKDKIKMYKLFNWRNINKGLFTVSDHKNNLYGLIYNDTSKLSLKCKKMVFHYYT